MNRKNIRFAFFQILSLILLALGVAGVIISGLGAGAVDALAYFLLRSTKLLNVGNWTIIINVSLVLFLIIATRKLAVLFTLLVVFVMGEAINIWINSFEKIFNLVLKDGQTLFSTDRLLIAIIIALVSLVVMAISVAIMIKEKTVKSPYDEFAIFLADKLNNYSLAKILLDGTFMLVAFLIAILTKGVKFTEQINVFSLIIVFGLGPLISLFTNLFTNGFKNKKQLVVSE